MNYHGTIIEESLKDTSVLKEIHILSTKVDAVTERHKTPWLTQWTLHKVEVPEKDAARIAEKLSKAIDDTHEGSWYADYKTEDDHFIIFKNKVFHITDRTNKAQYDEAKNYGISLGIPEYQVDFHPEVKEWKQ